MGTAEAEGLLTAELDRPKLQWLWTHGSYSVRANMPVGLFSRYLPALYGSGRTLAEEWPEEGTAALAPDASTQLPAAASDDEGAPSARVRTGEESGQPTPLEPDQASGVR